MKLIALVISTFFVATSASAAPMWLERQAVPKAVLADPRFERTDPASTTVVDHRLWSLFLEKYVVTGEDGVNYVRYNAVSAEDRAALGAYFRQLQGVHVSSLAPNEQLAFWINLYNATTVRLILDNKGVASITDIKKPWDQDVVSVDGVALTLNDIEHGIVRPIFRDARTHYALNCASIGCPNLAREAYRGADLEAQLDVAARAYVNHPRGVSVEKGRVIASKIYGWYREDFGADEKAVLAHIRGYADAPLAAALKGATKISGYRYDWALNAAR